MVLMTFVLYIIVACAMWSKRALYIARGFTPYNTRGIMYMGRKLAGGVVGGSLSIIIDPLS